MIVSGALADAASVDRQRPRQVQILAAKDGGFTVFSCYEEGSLFADRDIDVCLDYVRNYLTGEAQT